MKNLNNYILNEYQKLFLSDEVEKKTDDKTDLSAVATSRNIKSKEFYTNENLLRKAKNEL